MKMLNLGRFALAASGLAVAVAMPAHAQLITNSFATQASISIVPTTVESVARGSSSSMSGSNLGAVTLPVINGTGTVTAGVAAGGTVGEAFTFAQSVTEQDTVAAPVVTNAGAYTTPPDYSTVNVQLGGVGTGATATATSNNEGTIEFGASGSTVSLLQQNSLSVFK
jgi:hypothetical protein